jgi:hypothetical protein
MVQQLLIIKGLGTCKYPLGHNLNGLETIHGPKAKNGGAAPRQSLEVQLFQRLSFIPFEFGYVTHSIGKVTSLPFHGVQECPNWMLYATWAFVLMGTTPG